MKNKKNLGITLRIRTEVQAKDYSRAKTIPNALQRASRQKPLPSALQRASCLK